jgi:hypothetical protein
MVPLLLFMVISPWGTCPLGQSGHRLQLIENALESGAGAVANLANTANVVILVSFSQT